MLGTSCEMCLRWLQENTINDQSTLGQVMAWCLDGNKPLSGLMSTRIHVSVWRHEAKMI